MGRFTICYVRHGQTEDNVNHLVSGHRPVSLTELGLEQARSTGAALKGAIFDHIYVSDLNRTKQTFQGMKSMAPQLESVKYEEIPLIREKFGAEFQGMTNSQVEQIAKERNILIRQLKC